MRKSLAVGLLLVTLLAAACSKAKGPGPEQGVQKQVQPAGPVTLRIMVFEDFGALDPLISAFYAKNPDIRVEKVPFKPQHQYLPTDTEYRDKIQAREVDLVQIVGSTHGLSSQLLDLEPFIQKSRFDVTSVAADLDSLRVDGRLLDLPYDVAPWVVYYNKAAFRSRGVPEPKPGWTWDEFRTAAAALAQGGIPSAAGANFDYVFPLSVAGQSTPADDALVKALYQFLGGLVQTDKSLAKPGSATLADLYQGKVPIWVIGAAERVNVNSPQPLGMAPLPVPAGFKIKPYTWAQRLGIAATTTAPDAAWRFIQFADSPEGAEVIARSWFVPAARSEAARKAWLETHPADSAFLFDTTWQIMNNEATSPVSAAAPQAFTANLQSIMSGDKPWDAAYADYLSGKGQRK